MKKVLLSIASLLFYLQIYAQAPAEWYPGPNLVANPSFEKLRRALPDYDLDGSVAFRNSMDKWMSPTKTTPDLLFLANDYGVIDKPHSGKSMVGILTHNPASKRSDTYREYIQTKLNKALVIGEEYYVEFWVCRAASANMYSNNIGVAFSPVPITHTDFKPLLELKPSINEDKVINTNKREWVKISGKFTAANREMFLIIGNFFNNEQTIFGKAKDTAEKSFENPYYLIDDVGVYQLNLKPEPEPETFAEVEVKVGQVIQLDKIFFETAKWDLLAASFEELDQLVDLLNKYPSMKIAIHGHTDSRGSNNYNQKLSNNRAKAVFEYLFQKGITLNRIEYAGFGEERPIATNDSDEGRQINRRVEFVVLELEAENVDVKY